MATVITLQASDLISNSRADINTSIANLNSGKIETSVISTDTSFAAASDAKIASQLATKTYIDTSGGANASETVRGIVEEATDAEVTAGTATGGTTAKLFVTPAKLATRLSSLTAATIQIFTATGTWTKPSGLRYAIIELVGAGGGGGSNAGTATAGGTTSFGAHASATGGGAGGTGAGGGAGAGGVGSSGNLNIVGSDGDRSDTYGGSGGSSHFGGGGQGGITSGSTGSGGGAYGGGGGGGSVGSGGGGAGYSRKIIVNASLGATETVTVGAGGAGAISSGGTARDGGAGAAGVVIVTEFYT